MPVMVKDSDLVRQLKAERRSAGADCYDEVWEGVYVMPPLPNDVHQQMVMRIGSILQDEIGWNGLGEVRTGVNLSDRDKGWKKNYRVPDVVVFLQGGKARNLDTHWVGGPDFVVEICSRGDDTREKLPFYEAVQTQEVLIIDRRPWALELYRLRDGRLALVAKTGPKKSRHLRSEVVPFTFALAAGKDRPVVQISHQSDGRTWSV